jgi:hypothetical protein
MCYGVPEWADNFRDGLVSRTGSLKAASELRMTSAMMRQMNQPVVIS